MKADLENLGKWIDELAGDIADLEKKVAQITPQPTPPTPTPTGYHFKCDELIAGSTLTAGEVTVLENIADITGYDMLLVCLYDLSDGFVGETICPVSLVQLSRSFTLSSPYKYMEYTYKYAWRFRWQRQVITEQNYDTLTFFPIPDVTQNIMVAVYGLKIEADETQQRSIVQKATEAVKKVVKRKSTKGGRKKDAGK